MAQDKMFELFSDMNRQIGELVAEIRAIMNRLEKGDKKLEEHEHRIDALEKHHVASGSSASPWSPAKVLETVVKWGGWALAGLVAVIMKLTGTATPTISQ